MNEDALVKWFLDLFASRTPPKSVLDAKAEYRVTWTEILAKMRELSYKDNVVDLRHIWAEIYDKRLRKPVNKILRDNGEKPLRKDGGMIQN